MRRLGILVIAAVLLGVLLPGTQSGFAQRMKIELSEEERATLLSKLSERDREAIKAGRHAPEFVDELLYRVKTGRYRKPKLSVKERAALLSKLSEEEREVIKARRYRLAFIDELLLMEDEFLRKYKLGVDEMTKFLREHDPVVVPPGDLYDPIALAKYSHCVVIGKVKNVESHPEGPYHTWVTISVEQYLKGGSGEDEVLVKLITGEMKSGGRFTDMTEPKFLEGEHVLLHLYSLPGRLHDYIMSIVYDSYPRDSLYRTMKVCEGYFEIWEKFLIEDGKVFFGGRSKGTLDEVVKGVAAIMKGGQDAREK